MALYSRKIGVWGGSQTMWDSFQTIIKCKKLSLHSFLNPNCICMPMYVCACHKHSYAWLQCVYAYACMHVFRVSSGLSFPKIVLFFQKKVIFSTHTFLKSIFMRLGPKPILGFIVLLLLENEGPSCKGYKIWCLQMPIF